MNATYIITSSYLKIKNNKSSAKHYKFTINDLITLCDNQNIKKEFLMRDDVFLEVGRVQLLNTKNELDSFDFCYHTSKLTEELQNESNNELRNYLSKELYHRYMMFSGLISFLWFIRDNSARANIGVGYIDGNANCVVSIGQTKIFHANDGTFKDVTYTIDDIENTLVIMEKYSQVSLHHQLDKAALESQIVSSKSGVVRAVSSDKHYDEYNRIERAMMFLNMARSQYYLPYRIALYMPIFECLFANEAEGSSFKIPLRIGQYLGKNTAEKKQIFKSIQIAYNIRSRYLHGDKLNKSKKRGTKDYITMEDLINISFTVDDITRKLLTKVIIEDAHIFIDEEKLGELYTTLVFQ